MDIKELLKQINPEQLNTLYEEILHRDGIIHYKNDPTFIAGSLVGLEVAIQCITPLLPKPRKKRTRKSDKT